MLAATLARWLVDVPLPLFASSGASGSMRGLRHHRDAIDMAHTASAATIATMPDAAVERSIVPRSVGRAARRASGVIAISGPLDGVDGHSPPDANADRVVIMRLAGLQILIPSRSPVGPA